MTRLEEVRSTVRAQAQIPFEHQSRPARVALTLLIPAVYGVLCGLTLRWSTPVYWTLQLIAALCGIAGGYAHRSTFAATRSGTLSGATFGLAVLLGHTLAATRRELPAPTPEWLPAITTGLGCALAVIGAAARHRELPLT